MLLFRAKSVYGINENATQLPASGDQGQDKGQSF